VTIVSMFRSTVAPLALIATTPVFIYVLWYTAINFQGSILTFAENVSTQEDIVGYFWNEIMPSTDCYSWKIMGAFIAFEAFVMVFCPGKQYIGPVSPSGERPVYKANGMQSFFISMFVFAYMLYNGVDVGTIYDHWGNILATMNAFGLVFCLFLYFKGMYFPSSKDHGSSGNPVIDYYWGTELYPRVFGIDIKTLVNCRTSMMGWALSVMCFAYRHYTLNDGDITKCYAIIVSAALQVIYLAKFFWWETGYFASMDIQHDRAGFYIIWGCLVWVPAVYTYHTFCLVGKGVHVDMSLEEALVIFGLGLAMIFLNYWADYQREIVRATDGETTIWGRKAEIIRTKYVTDKGEEKSSLLLASGFWGITRHFHYIPEISAAFFWSVSNGFGAILPYFYVIFLTILLMDRAGRDDIRCSNKYKKYWDEYRQRVPYKVIPYIY